MTVYGTPDEAAENLRRIEEYRLTFRQRTQSNDRFIYLTLAATYFIGFVGQFCAMTVFPERAVQASIIVAAAGSLALCVIVGHSFHKYLGVRGRASVKPAYFGVSWLLGLVTIIAFTVLMGAQFPAIDATYIAYTASCVLVGGMYFGAGVCFNNHKELLLGAWLMAVGIAAAIAGMPFALLIIGTLAAAGFLRCAFTSTDSQNEVS